MEIEFMLLMQLKKNIIIPKKGNFNLTDLIKLTIVK